jgi:hypothetical protein
VIVLVLVLMLLFLGGFVGVGVFALRVLTGARRSVDAIAAELRLGAIPGMVHWHPALLGQLCSDWVGATHYVRGGFGNRDAAAGKLFVAGQRVPALAFLCETEQRGTQGRIELVTSVARFAGQIDRGAVWFGSPAGPLGAMVMQTGVLLDPSGQAIGQLARGGADPFAPVYLRGRCIGAIDQRSDSHAALPAVTRPLFSALDVRSAEEEAWLLVLAVLELGCFAVLRAHGRMRSDGLALGVP